MTTISVQHLNDKAWARWTALLLLSATMLFASVFTWSFSPLQSTLKLTEGWDPTTYGNFSAAVSFLNVFVFFLLISGIILDKMGARFTAVLATSVMAIGGSVCFWSLSESFEASDVKTFMESHFNLPRAWWNLTPFYDGMPASAKLAALGYMLFGCGIEMAGITVSRSIVKWFAGKEMALAMGIEIAFVRLSTVIVFLCVPAISTWGGITSVSRPIGLSVFLLLIGLIFMIIYFFMDRVLDKESGVAEKKSDPFKISDLKLLVSSKVFWIVALLYATCYSAIFPFQNYAINMLQCNIGISAEDAGFIFFIFPLGAAALTPFAGNYLDRNKRAATMLITGTSLMIACHLTFALLLPATRSALVAFGAIIMLGVAFALIPASLYPSVPRIVQPKLLGSAYAAILWIQNLCLYGCRKGVGALLQAVNPDVNDPMEYNYTIPMLVFTALAVTALLLALNLKRTDRRKKYGLDTHAEAENSFENSIAE